MNWGYIAGLFFGLCLCSFVLTKVAITLLRQRQMFDIPNDRSSHVAPTPRGGGLAVIATLLLGLAICGVSGLAPPLLISKLAGITFLLALVSWVDDLYGLGPLIRFGAHILGVAGALYMGLVSGPFFGGMVAPTLELVLIGIGWVWFINLFNFMDGIDGIAASETLAIGLGGSALILLTKGDPSTALIALLIAASALGFLPHNWNPAKIFLGDIGSVPLGFVCGWVLLSLASQGLGVAAFILSLVFFSDATLTLFKRLIRKEKFWQPHRQHFYQKAVQRGLTHSHVTMTASIANACLIVLAYWSTTGKELLALGASFLVITLLFSYYLKFPIAPKPDRTVP